MCLEGFLHYIIILSLQNIKLQNKKIFFIKYSIYKKLKNNYFIMILLINNIFSK